MNKAIQILSITTLLGLLSAPAPGCSPFGGEKAVDRETWRPEPGARLVEFDFQGRRREMIVQVPKKYSPAASYPVVFAFHGAGRMSRDWLDWMRGLADDKGFVGVYPQALSGAWEADLGGENADDLGLTEDILRWLGSVLKVDSSRVYAAGWSLGGIFACRLARNLPAIAAVAAVSGSFYQNPRIDDSMAHPALMIVHGRLDPVIPYQGGMNYAGYYYEPAESSARLWASHNGCRADPEREELKAGVSLTRYQCAPGREVALYCVEEGSHFLFESEGWLAEEIWEFFERNAPG
ncbi:MAG: dienelactone hydrolase family protein [Candidatus Glassbacteria bacterium]